MYRRRVKVPKAIYAIEQGSAWYELARESPVIASASGKVTAVGTTSYGTHVIIAHTGTGLITFYQHLEKVYVKKGQTVKKGQQIGIAGHGSETPIRHLHFEIRKWNGKTFRAFDPELTMDDWTILDEPVMT